MAARGCKHCGSPLPCWRPDGNPHKRSLTYCSAKCRTAHQLAHKGEIRGTQRFCGHCNSALPLSAPPGRMYCGDACYRRAARRRARLEIELEPPYGSDLPPDEVERRYRIAIRYVRSTARVDPWAVRRSWSFDQH